MEWTVTGPEGQEKAFPTRAQARAFVRENPGWRSTGEYKSRIERGLARGLTRAEARGHPPKGISYVPERHVRTIRVPAGVEGGRTRTPREQTVGDLLAGIRRFRQAFPGVKRINLALHGKPYRDERIVWRMSPVHDLDMLEQLAQHYERSTALSDIAGPPIGATLGMDDAWQSVIGFKIAPMT